jgi:hypothetical protein
VAALAKAPVAVGSAETPAELMEVATAPVSVRTGMMEVPRKGSERVRRKLLEGSV